MAKNDFRSYGITIHLCCTVSITGCDLAIHSNLTDLLYSSDQAAVQTHHAWQKCSVMAAAAFQEYQHYTAREHRTPCSAPLKSVQG